MKILKNLNRIKVRLSKGYQGEYLSIWIGTNKVGAHKLGKAVQPPRGVRVGRHYSWDSVFLMQPMNTNHDLIWTRDDYWSHKYRKSKKSGRWMWMGLPIAVMTERIDYEAEASLKKLEPALIDRFTDLLCQELNYVFKTASNIES